MGAVLLQMNPVGTFVVCVVTRVFVGLLPALIYQMLKKIKIANVFSVGLCCFLTPLVNTILYITGSYLIFADAWMELAVAAGYGGEGGISLLGFMFAMVAANPMDKVTDIVWTDVRQEHQQIPRLAVW